MVVAYGAKNIVQGRASRCYRRVLQQTETDTRHNAMRSFTLYTRIEDRHLHTSSCTLHLPTSAQHGAMQCGPSHSKRIKHLAELPACTLIHLPTSAQHGAMQCGRSHSKHIKHLAELPACTLHLKPWDATRRSSSVAPRACVRVYARVLVPPNPYIHTYILYTYPHPCNTRRLHIAKRTVFTSRGVIGVVASSLSYIYI